MRKLKKIPDFQVSLLPGNFVFCAYFPYQEGKFALSDRDFLAQILGRYQLISAYVKTPLYFLLFKSGDEFYESQPLFQSILTKNYFSILTHINKHYETKNVINVALPDSSAFKSEVLMRAFTDPYLFPILPLPVTQKIKTKLQSKELHFHQSLFGFPSIPSLSVISPYSKCSNKEDLKSEDDWPDPIFFRDKVKQYENVRFYEDEFHLNNTIKQNALHFSKPGLNTEELFSTAAKNFYFANSILNRVEPGWLASKNEKRDNRIPLAQLRSLNGEIKTGVKYPNSLADKLRFVQEQIPGEVARVSIHENYEEGVLKSDISSAYKQSLDFSQGSEEIPGTCFLTTGIPFIYTKPLSKKYPAGFSPENYFSPDLIRKLPDDAFSQERFRITAPGISGEGEKKNEFSFQQGSLVKSIHKTWEEPPQKFHLSKFPIGAGKSSEQKYTTDRPSLVYSHPKVSKISPEPIQEEEVSRSSQSSNLAPSLSPSLSNEIGAVQSDSAPEAELVNLVDRVYSLIEERVRREREMRGY